MSLRLACLSAILAAPVLGALPDAGFSPGELERARLSWPGEVAGMIPAAAEPRDAAETARVELLAADVTRRRGADRAAALLYERWLRSHPLSSLRPEASLGFGVATLGIPSPRAARGALAGARRAFPFCAVEDDLLFWEAEASWQMEDQASARRMFEEFAGRYPLSGLKWQALYRLGWVERSMGDLEPAAVHFGEAAAGDPAMKAPGTLQRAWTLLELGRTGDAEDLFVEVEKSFPGTAHAREALMGKAECAYRKKDFSGAGELYDSALAGAPDEKARAAIRYSLAWAALKQERAEDARRRFLEIEKDYPADRVAPFAAYRAALCLLKLDRADDALLELRGVQARHPRHEAGEWSVYSRGWIYLSLKRFNEAKAAFRSLLDQYPGGRLVAPARYLIAATLYQERHFLEAEREFLSFATSHRESGLADGALLWAAWAAVLNERPRSALSHLDALEREFPLTRWRDDAAVAEGEAAFAVKDYARAKSAYLRASKAPDDGATRLRGLTGLGWCAFATREWKTAERMFSAVLKEAPPGPMRERSRVRLADALFNQKRYGAAEPHYEKAVRGDIRPLASWSLLQLGWCSFRRGKPDEARKRWGELARKWPGSAEAPLARMASAETLFGQERFVEAEREFRQIARKSPKGSDEAETASLRVGDCLYNAKSYESAVLAYREFTREYPKSARLAEALFGMQWAYLQLGEYEKARREAAAFLDKFPQASLAAEVKLMVAESYRRESKPDEALGEYHEFLKQYPKSDLVASVLVKIGEAQEEVGAFKDAEATYSDFLARHPDHPLAGEAAFRLGITRFRNGDVAGAVDVFGKIAEEPANPRAPEAIFNLVMCHKSQADELRMTGMVRKLTDEFPSSRAAAQANLVMGYYLVDDGRADRGAAYLKTAAESSFAGISAEARYALGEVLMQDGKLDAALESYLAGAAHLPRGGEWAVQCAFAAANEHAAAGRHGDAMELFRSVLEMDEANPEWKATAYFGVGQQYEAMGKISQAKLMYAKSVETTSSPELKDRVTKRLEGLEPKPAPAAGGAK